MNGKHYKITAVPNDPSYIDAFCPRVDGRVVLWFDDSGRERAAKAENLKIDSDGSWNFWNPSYEQHITFVPVEYPVIPPFWNDEDALKSVCLSPIDDGRAYFRPFLCRGKPADAKTFLVGINPATPITPRDVDIENYVDMLNHYDSFLRFYEKHRLAQGKRGISPTRRGIDAFGRWLEEQTGAPVLETNVITYPTRKASDLKRQPEYILQKGRQIFNSLLLGIRPQLIVLHGAETVDTFFQSLEDLGLAKDRPPIGTKIEDIERSSPLSIFTYPDGLRATVFACRHLRFYGNAGARYREFQDRICSTVQQFGK